MSRRSRSVEASPHTQEVDRHRSQRRNHRILANEGVLHSHVHFIFCLIFDPSFNILNIGDRDESRRRISRAQTPALHSQRSPQTSRRSTSPPRRSPRRMSFSHHEAPQRTPSSAHSRQSSRLREYDNIERSRRGRRRQSRRNSSFQSLSP